eukprot:CAMPEP_0172190266 /NCGR_PEP_ID=MMETSP1050-20130122/23016_1 /TAXON_ID=233186 /ORGANISM="Cryptomonas curvata, Strain CCAP979/52" /LENGTH=189 /DNA_ID=CAMNT_0012865117 /DNA_START=205 /DNA_END=770 /DNA_ORIENTATION=-
MAGCNRSTTQRIECSREYNSSLMLRKVAFGIKHSKESYSAFLWACANLVQLNDTVFLVHVYQKDNILDDGGFLEACAVITQYEDSCRRQRLKYRSLVVPGNPAEKIAALASFHQFDLVILGSKRRNHLVRTLLGCTASAISQRCPCPTMVIKQPKDEAGAYLRTFPRRICLHADDSAAARAALDWAAAA